MLSSTSNAVTMGSPPSVRASTCLGLRSRYRYWNRDIVSYCASCSATIESNALYGLVEVKRVYDVVIFLDEAYALMGVNIAVCLPLRQTISLGKAIYYSDDILDYISYVALHIVCI